MSNIAEFAEIPEYSVTDNMTLEDVNNLVTEIYTRNYKTVNGTTPPLHSADPITLTYYIGAGNAKGASIVQENVTKAVEEFQQWQRSIGRDISPMELIYRLRVAGVKRVELRQPVYMVVEGGSDLEKATVQIPKLSGIPTIIYGGVEDD